jgi:acetyl-CoA carboxylase biotin carboxyl carrier protein
VSSDLEVIKAIVDAFERSDWAEIDVSSASLRIHLSTQPQTGAGPAASIPAAVPAVRTRRDLGGAATAADTAEAGPTMAAAIPAGSDAVRSPSPGIFWRSPHPGAPPFADVGDVVDSGSTLGIVEVMKLMNHITSGTPGTVVGVFVENGMRVDRGDVLFAIEPSASP